MFFQNIKYGYVFIIVFAAVLFFVIGFFIRKKSLSRFYSSVKNISALNKSLFSFRLINSVLMVLTFVFLSIAVMRPKWGIIEATFQSSATDIVFVLDLSSSMNTTDIKPSRLERAKYEIIDFIKRTENIRVGLVVFAGSNFIASPITYDKDSFIVLLNSLTPNSMTIPGTRIADALETASNIFIDDINKRSLIVVTDGEDNGSEGVNVMEKLAAKNISVYGVTIGTKEGDAVPSFDNMGRSTGYKKTRSGMAVVSKREDAFLENITKQTGGEFYVSESGVIPFGKIYNSVKKNESVKSKELDMRYYVERHQIFVFAALVFLIAEITLSFLFPLIAKKDGNSF